MRTTARFLRLLTLALWVGGIVFFAFVVAPLAFTVLPSTHEAGAIVGAALRWLHAIGLASCVIFALAWEVETMRRSRQRHTAWIALIGTVLLMGAVTAVSQFWLLPRMDRDLATAGGDITMAAEDAPARRDFNRLHGVSVDLEAGVLLLGLIAIWLEASTAVPTRMAAAAIETRQPSSSV
jgi:uncharacterized membrane protein